MTPVLFYDAGTHSKPSIWRLPIQAQACVACTGCFAGKPVPTGTAAHPVGAGSPAKRPAQTNPAANVVNAPLQGARRHLCPPARSYHRCKG
ncbi:hypothetical protein EJA05_01750 [Pseudomonas oryziphila]|uniref:Uncharacterized protein n=1 Tax=Pseudomonas entomophila TaxID=312306 RepID=A0A3Q8TYJ7_9PSED|nr:hypothetical protein EJA05_01750 [Pseudomonas oryziphila]